MTLLERRAHRIILFCFSFGLFACRNDSVPIDGASKFLVDSLILEKPDLSLNPITGTNICYKSDGKNVILWYFSRKKVYKYSVIQKCNVDSIDISFDTAVNFYHAYFYVDANNKLYILDRGHQNSITVISNKGLSKIKYRDTTKPDNYLYVAYCPFVVQENIILSKLPYYFLPDASERKKYFSSKILSIFNIRDSSLIEKRNFAIFPEEFKTKYFYVDRPVACMVNDSIAYYCFPDKNIIYKYNINTDVAQTIPVDNIMENEMTPFDTDSITSLSYAVKYAITSNNFVSISHDEYSNRILLLQTLKIKYSEDSLGHIPLYDDKPVIANIIDSNYKCIKKIKFDRQLYCTTTFYHKNRLYVPSFKGKSVIIYVYEI